MDFSDSREEAEYRAKARRWLQSNAPILRRQVAHGRENKHSIAVDKAWQAKKAEAGFACISWPREWGGAGGTPSQAAIFEEEEEKFGLSSDTFALGLNMCVPTIMAAGKPADKARFAGPALRGEEIWCQLFSEPSAGSDLAAARTRAVRTLDGSGDWIVNGQKVWTSGAQYSDFGLLVTRTNLDAPKHKGLTVFWVSMTAPGIEVRPIHQADGGFGFNEVYFTDVRITDSQRVGEVNKGWSVALTTLMNERLAVGGDLKPGWQELMDLAKTLPSLEGGGRALQDGALRAMLADWHVTSQGLRFTRLRAQTALSRDQTPGPEASIGKIVSARLAQELATEVSDRLDQAGILANDDLGTVLGGFQRNFFWGAALRIAGGTDEILKNVIAERVLGLPADIRIDRDVAFRDVPGVV